MEEVHFWEESPAETDLFDGDGEHFQKAWEKFVTKVHDWVELSVPAKLVLLKNRLIKKKRENNHLGLSSKERSIIQRPFVC